MTTPHSGEDDVTAHGHAGGDPPLTTSTITCPQCASRSEERMPADACVVRWECPGCGAELRPREGDCCVFCSYGSRPCPPEQG